MSEYIGKVISYNEFQKAYALRREHFIPYKVFSTVKAKIDNKEQLLFYPTYLKETSHNFKYAIMLMGILEDGRKVAVLLNDIEPYFEVMIPHNLKESKAQFVNNLKSLLATANAEPTRLTSVKGKPFKYFQEYESEFIRMYFTTTKKRKEAFKVLEESKQKYRTATDDKANYYRVVCRDYLTTYSNWVTLNNYKIIKDSHIKPTTILLSIDDYQPYKQSGELPPSLSKDKTLSCCWDIETYTPTQGFANYNMPDDRIFCIGATFQWIHEANPIVKIVFCDVEAAPLPDTITVVCKTEENIIRGFAEILDRMEPEFVFGFNDSDFDWKWLIARAERTTNLLSYIAETIERTTPYHQQTDADIKKWKFRSERIKIEAGTDFEGYALFVDGYIPVDVRTVYRKIYPTSDQSSLKFFLEKSNLNSKEDMPYQRMFQIYRKLHAAKSDDPEYPKMLEDMALVNKYCVVDALRCHELMLKRNVIIEKRETSNLAYCSVADSFYRADGMKVRNLTIAVGQQAPFNIRFTTIPTTVKREDKFPGAYVFPPEKGLKTSKLSFRERIQKAVETQNTNLACYPEWLNTPEEEVKQYEEIIKEHNLINEEHPMFKELPRKVQEFFKEPMYRPITGLDFASLYPSLMRAYNFSPEKLILDKKYAREYYERTKNKLTRVDFQFGMERCVGWFVWHNNNLDIKKEPFEFGVYPYILNNLFQMRAEVKKKMKDIDHILEDPAKLEKLTLEEQTELQFKRSCINSKQSAIKVYMNTFYGETGNQNSPFFVVHVAGGITSYGQINIKKGQKFVEERNWQVCYGDTDSLYVAGPHEYFKEVDRLYYSNQITKLEYWTQLVNITFKAIKEINTGVNKMFIDDNGTEFLKMAYEEVLWPCSFLAKKKYYGIPHENIVNFNVKLFIRGLDLKKRGVSDFMKSICESIMYKSMSVENLYSALELVQLEVKNIYNTKWDLDKFVQTAVYRIDKENVRIINFVERMREKNIEIVPGERFKYVMVIKYPWKYDERGRKSALSAADKMELLEEALKNNYTIDIDYYMESSINGQLARLIVGHDIFHAEPFNYSEDEIKIADKKTYANACKYIEKFCQSYYAKYNDLGAVYKNLYKQADTYIGGAIKKKDKLTYKLLTANLKLSAGEVKEKDGREQFVNWILTSAQKEALVDKNYGENWLRKKLKDVPKEERKGVIVQLQQKYYGNKDNVLKNSTEQFQYDVNIYRNKLREHVEKYAEMYNEYNLSIMQISDLIKNSLNITDEIMKPTDKPIEYTVESFGELPEEKAEEIATIGEAVIGEITKKYKDEIEKFKTIYEEVKEVYVLHYKVTDVVKVLKMKRDRACNILHKPDDEEFEENLQEDIDKGAAELDL
jgi:DNA polymerase elongation subunit (family B)